MIKNEIKKLIQEAIKSHWEIDLELDEIKIDYPPEGFGDYSTNVAMKLAKIAKSNPMEVAEEIAEHLHPFCHSEGARRPKNLNDEILPPHQVRGQDDMKECFFEKIDVIKPGFINFYLTQKALQNEVEEINKQEDKYGDLNIGAEQKVQVEFISANPTGPLTLGNGRGGFYGDVLANVLKKAGFDVKREYYINDVGEQIRKLGHSVIGDEQAVYKGEYINDIKKSLPASPFQREEKNAEEIGKEAAKIIMEEMIKPTIENRMKIKFDVWFKEADLYTKNEVEKILEYLKEKELTYEQDGARWFKLSQFEDEKDRVLVKASGEKTYLASDIAYIKNKFERGFDKLIYIWGADHHGYIGRLKAAVLALGFSPDNVEIIIMQLVRLMQGGKEVRMSKRAGTYITIDDLLDEIPLDVARFFFLMRSPDSHLNFDLDLAKKQSEKNPVYYTQYASARMRSILTKLKTQNSKLKATTQNLKLLNHENELKLIKQLIRFPEIVEDIARDYQVHRLPHYALDLVKSFHKFYEECRVIDEKNPDLTEVRLALVRATQIILKNALDLMGISAPEKM